MLPRDEAEAAAAIERIDALAAEEDLTVLGWRELPTDPDAATWAPSPGTPCRASGSCSSVAWS